MTAEYIHHNPREIAAGLDTNPNVPYRRKIVSVEWMPPNKLPIVFHTTSSDGLNQVSPAFCQSFDYSFQGGVIPVTYVLPWPHINRVKGSSEIWGPIKKEAFEKTQIPYTYLMVKNDKKDYGRIRMGSTMVDQFLLACANSGFVFKAKVAEIKRDGTKALFTEYLSLLDLPVIDAHKFTSPSDVGFGASNGKSFETHLPLDIQRPELVGFQTLGNYLESVRDSGQRIKIFDTANALADAHPSEVMHGVFEKLVEINRGAINSVPAQDSRLLIALEPFAQR